MFRIEMSQEVEGEDEDEREDEQNPAPGMRFQIVCWMMLIVEFWA